MKITEQTATELKIQTRSVCDFLLHGCLLIVIGLKWAAFDCNFATVICHRMQAKQGDCQLVRSSWLGSNTQEIQLAALQAAKVVKLGCASKVVFVTDSGDVFLTHNYNHWQNQEFIAVEINAFVQNAERAKLELKQHDNLSEYLGCLCMALGIAVIAFGKNEIYSFDRTSDKLTVKQQSLWGTQVSQYPLHAIYGVEVERLKDKDNDIWYRINLLAKKGDRISLPSVINSYKQQEIAKAINNYLNARDR